MFLTTLSKDGSAYDSDGNLIFASYEKFTNEICRKGYCFICGEKPSNSFNDEHIFPNWVLKTTNSHNRRLILPNEQPVKYSTYKIACCQPCNTKLGEVFEKPLSEVFSGGFKAVKEYVNNGGAQHLCAWLCLIFLKVHLRDFKNPSSLDARENNSMLGSHYDLHELHHIHAVARSRIVGVHVSHGVFGSLNVLNTEKFDSSDMLDYCDGLAGRTVLLRVKDVALVYVLDDCGGCNSMLEHRLHTFIPSNAIQLREIYAHYSAANIHLISRPEFGTEINKNTGQPRIVARKGALDYHDYNPTIFGEIFAHALEPYKYNIKVKGKTGEEALDEVRSGELSFLSGK
ncbi:MAG: hypothetical protein CMF62_08535 [Magnetococcales bacterium]|nr:hypothetical protein [Magnetococcales bacterium]|tara:strand:+ start:591796 stop:592824 length:1029 start_codon:yes stop_codon:yes gene_type:complete